MHKVAFGCIWFFVFCIPWENLLVVPGIGTAGRLVGLVAIFLSLFAVIFEKAPIRFHCFHAAFLLFVFVSALTFFWTVEQEATLQRSWTYTQLFAMSLLIFQWADRTERVMWLLQAYVLGSYVAVFSLLLNYADSTTGYWQRASASGFNPNDISIIIALAIPFAWYLVVQHFGRIFSWANRLYPFVAPIAIALTASRNGLIAMLLSMSFLFVTLPWQSWGKRLVLLGGVAGALFLALYIVPMAALERWGTTAAEVVEGTLNSRMLIWNAGWQMVAENPLLGAGAGTSRFAMEPILGTVKAPHNVYLAIAVDSGLLGIIAFILLLWALAKAIRRMPRLEKLLWVVLISVWAVTAMASNWEWRKQTWILFSLLATHSAALCVAIQPMKPLKPVRNLVPGKTGS